MKIKSKFAANKIDRAGKPYTVVPKSQRLKAYKEALEIVSNPNKLHSGLCILLVHQVGLLFIDSPDTDLLFPEFGQFIDLYQPTKYVDLYYTDKIKWRIKVLKECIKLCN